MLATLLAAHVSAQALHGTSEDERPAADTESATRQSRDDAWWTGPIIANSASTLPAGHFLVEPYLYAVTSHRAKGYRSLTYLLYGVTDDLTVGMTPYFGFNDVKNGPNSSRVVLGDIGIQADYSLHRFHEDSWVPEMSLKLEETLPTGKYDKLGNRPNDGLGAGAYATTVQLNTQSYFWLPNGRILRMRTNIAESWSRKTSVDGVSVYGTDAGFHGHANPGNTFFFDAAWEYSLTQRWVLATDLAWWHNRPTRVDGFVIPDVSAGSQSAVRFESKSSDSYALAPAIEYNFSGNLGLLFGARYMTGRHTTTTVTPVVAVNYVH